MSFQAISDIPADGLNIRWPDPPLVQKHDFAIHQNLRGTRLLPGKQAQPDHCDAPVPRLSILTAGKSYLDVRQALDELGIDDALAAENWYPSLQDWHGLAARTGRRPPFCRRLGRILVVRRKASTAQYQLKEELYNWREDVRPRVVWQFDELGEWSHGEWLLPAASELPVATIARVIAGASVAFTSPTIAARLQVIEAQTKQPITPWF